MRARQRHGCRGRASAARDCLFKLNRSNPVLPQISILDKSGSEDGAGHGSCWPSQMTSVVRVLRMRPGLLLSGLIAVGVWGCGDSDAASGGVGTAGSSSAGNSSAGVAHGGSSGGMTQAGATNAGAAGSGHAAGAAGTGVVCDGVTCAVNQYCRAPCSGTGGTVGNASCADLPAVCSGVPSCSCICGITSSFCKPGAPEVQCGCG